MRDVRGAISKEQVRGATGTWPLLILNTKKGRAAQAVTTMRSPLRCLHTRPLWYGSVVLKKHVYVTKCVGRS